MIDAVNAINQDFYNHHQTLGRANLSAEVNPANKYMIVQGDSEQEVVAKRVVVFRRRVDYGFALPGFEWEEIVTWISTSEHAQWCMKNSSKPLHLMYQQNYLSASWDFAILAYFEPKVLTAYLLKCPEQ